MIVLLWLAGIVAVESLICLYFTTNVAWSSVLAIIFFFAFAVVAWASRHLTSDSRKGRS